MKHNVLKVLTTIVTYVLIAGSAHVEQSQTRLQSKAFSSRNAQVAKGRVPGQTYMGK